MPQAKKKQSTKTAKKPAAKKTTSAARSTSRKSCTKTANCKQDNRMRNHIYIVTALSMIALLLLCADAAMLMV